jgi:DNA-binding transcriptional ArsR family regulator
MPPIERPPSAEGNVGAVFQALVHPMRRRLLWELRQAGGSLTAGHIAARLPCAASSTSRHLAILQKAGLVRLEVKGARHIYRLASDRLLRVAGAWILEVGGADSLDGAA